MKKPIRKKSDPRPETVRYREHSKQIVILAREIVKLRKRIDDLESIFKTHADFGGHK